MEDVQFIRNQQKPINKFRKSPGATPIKKSGLNRFTNGFSSISSPRQPACRIRLLAFVGLFLISAHSAKAFSGATVPWTTYEAENMTISGGTILTSYTHNNVAAESSGRECVQLNGMGQYVQFTNQSAANAIVVRYSVPDTSDGTGTNYTLSLYTNTNICRKAADDFPIFMAVWKLSVREHPVIRLAQKFLR